MIRLSRAGRKKAILEALERLEAGGRFKAFTQGEICRKMGITSQSKIRDILLEMCDDHQLACGSSAIDGYADELRIYSRRFNNQSTVPMSYGTYINGEWVEMSGEVLAHA